MSRAILPGSHVGVLGSGQLGRMFAMAARRMGYRVHVYSPDSDTPTGQVADVEVSAPYEDLDAVRRFASTVEVVTFEFENVPHETAEAAAEHAHVRPAGRVLHVAQNREREKTFLARAGLPVPRFEVVRSADDLDGALGRLGCPAILKTARFGYDGKGQARIDGPPEAATAWATVGRQECVVEELVDFECELAVVAARGLDGAMVDHGAIETRHRNHILDVAVAPATVPAGVQREAQRLAYAVLEALDVVGVLCVEMFLARDGRLLINEIAPRPHNSGHLTIDASVTSQFEQQLRTVCGLPLGSTAQVSPAAMANLLGDLWQQGVPKWEAACARGNVKLHLYGKAAARPGRKMGHLTALAPAAADAVRDVLAARDAL